MDTKELETFDLLYYSPVDENGGLFGPPFPVVHDQLLRLAHIEGEEVVFAPHCQLSDLLPIGCLIVVGDQAYHCWHGRFKKKKYIYFFLIRANFKFP